MAIYMIGYISYGATLVFYAAVFPRLARNTPHAKDLKRKYDNGEVDKEVYSKEVSLEMNRISNISTVSFSVSLVPEDQRLIRGPSDALQYRIPVHSRDQLERAPPAG